MASVASDRELIEAVVNEMSAGIECALGFWMGQIETALEDPRLTTLGRLNAIRAVMQEYRYSTVEKEVRVDGYVA